MKRFTNLHILGAIFGLTIVVFQSVMPSEDADLKREQDSSGSYWEQIKALGWGAFTATKGLAFVSQSQNQRWVINAAEQAKGLVEQGKELLAQAKDSGALAPTQPIDVQLTQAKVELCTGVAGVLQAADPVVPKLNKLCDKLIILADKTGYPPAKIRHTRKKSTSSYATRSFSSGYSQGDTSLAHAQLGGASGPSSVSSSTTSSMLGTRRQRRPSCPDSDLHTFSGHKSTTTQPMPPQTIQNLHALQGTLVHGTKALEAATATAMAIGNVADKFIKQTQPKTEPERKGEADQPQNMKETVDATTILFRDGVRPALTQLRTILDDAATFMQPAPTPQGAAGKPQDQLGQLAKAAEQFNQTMQTAERIVTTVSTAPNQQQANQFVENVLKNGAKTFTSMLISTIAAPIAVIGTWFMLNNCETQADGQKSTKFWWGAGACGLSACYLFFKSWTLSSKKSNTPLASE